MPSSVFYNMPTESINDVLYSAPIWILVDILRQYNDPVTSFWRLKDKTFHRASIILKHYPLQLYNGPDIPLPKSSNVSSDILESIFNFLKTKISLIFIGSIAQTFYEKRSSKFDFSEIICFSTDFETDTKQCYNFLSKLLKQDLSVELYNPFYQFTDELYVFKSKTKPVLKIFGTNGICIPYNNLIITDTNKPTIKYMETGGFYKKEPNTSSIKLGTFMVHFNSVLIQRHRHYINRSELYKNSEKQMLTLLQSREQFLNTNNSSVLDHTPYREFIVRCAGLTIDQGRKFRMGYMERKEAKKRPMFSFEPKLSNPNPEIPDHRFANTSGEKVKNSMTKLLKN